MSKSQELVLKAQGFYESRISAYKVLGSLGSGAFGQVTLCEHKNSGIKVAVKVTSKAKIEKTFDCNNEEFKELEVMKELTQEDCRNVVKCLEVFSDDEQHYLVTEYMPQGDLSQHLKTQGRWPLSEEEAKSIFKPLAIALSDLHSRKILHRDIKLENVLVSHEKDSVPTVKLGDFGSAVKLASDDAKETFRIGTPCYMAPEIIKAQPYGLEIDIWSLGVLLHLILSASFPFYDKDLSKVKGLTCNAPLDLEKGSYLPGLSADVKDLIYGMLIKEPSRRMTIEEVLAHPWFV